MANKSKGTGYVSFELPRGKRKRVRATKTFPDEREAKAGTLNPHLPKRTIAAAQILEWLEEPDEADLA